MSPLKEPIEQHLRRVLDEASIAQVGQRIRAARTVPSRRRGWVVAAAATAAIAVVVVVAMVLRPHEPQPFTLADGSVMPRLLEATTERQVLDLSDGSHVQLEPATHAEVLANQPGKMTLLVRSGRARFEVNPAAHGQWLVEAGLVTVEVVGTIFTVSRSDAGVDVQVERGVVIVRGNQLPDHLVRLEAGKHAFVPSPSLVPPLPADVSPPPTDDQRPPAPVETKPTQGPPAWKAAARAGDFTRAWALIEPNFEATVVKTTRAEELVLLADTARSTAHDAAARLALSRALTVAPTDRSAGTTAFTLARLEFAANDLALAAEHFGLAANDPALGPLAEDAALRRLQALWALGEQATALDEARALVRRFPTGVHTAALNAWLADETHQPPWQR